jgi:ATP-dependent protease ClpP protease subunit
MWKSQNKRKLQKTVNEDSESESDDESDELVWMEDNHIFFYTDVSDKSIAKLNSFIFQLNKENTKYLYLLKNKTIEQTFPPIFLHIKSYGGCVMSALAAIDIMETSMSPIYTIIEGYAASAATMLSIMGEKRYMHKNAHMLIHQMSSGFWGKMEEIKDEMKNLNRIEKVITKIYKDKAEIPNKTYNKILKHDLWWSAKRCLKYKLVDEII